MNIKRKNKFYIHNYIFLSLLVLSFISTNSFAHGLFKKEKDEKKFNKYIKKKNYIGADDMLSTLKEINENPEGNLVSDMIVRVVVSYCKNFSEKKPDKIISKVSSKVVHNSQGGSPIDYAFENILQRVFSFKVYSDNEFKGLVSSAQLKVGSVGNQCVKDRFAKASEINSGNRTEKTMPTPILNLGVTGCVRSDLISNANNKINTLANDVSNVRKYVDKPSSITLYMDEGEKIKPLSSGPVYENGTLFYKEIYNNNTGKNREYLFIENKNGQYYMPEQEKLEESYKTNDLTGIQLQFAESKTKITFPNYDGPPFPTAIASPLPLKNKLMGMSTDEAVRYAEANAAKNFAPRTNNTTSLAAGESIGAIRFLDFKNHNKELLTQVLVVEAQDGQLYALDYKVEPEKEDDKSQRHELQIIFKDYLSKYNSSIHGLRGEFVKFVIVTDKKTNKDKTIKIHNREFKVIKLTGKVTEPAVNKKERALDRSAVRK
jgi:hypothetical protein